MQTITFDQFEAVDIRIGKVLESTDFPEGRFSTHILIIDFGPDLGKKKSLARLKPNYAAEELIGKLVLGVVNFEPRQIGKHKSEVLTLGFADTNGDCILVSTDKDVPLGGKLH